MANLSRGNAVAGRRWLFALILIVGIALRIGWVGRPLDHRLPSPWRQADSFQIARNFAREDGRILYPRIDWRGDTPGLVEMELPLLPWTGGMLFRVFGPQAPILRALSCLLEIGSLLLFTTLARRLLPEAGALFAVAAFAVNPLLVYLATALQPEPLMLFLILVSAVFLERWNERGGDAALLLSAAALGGAILAKAPAACVGILIGWVILRREGLAALKRPQVWLAVVLALLPAGLWYTWAQRFFVVYGNSLGLSNEYPFLGFDMLWPPRFLLGILKWETLGVVMPLGWILLVFSLRAPQVVERPLVWFVSVSIFLVAAARTTADDWAFYYHSIAVAPAYLLIGAGYIVISRTRPILAHVLVAGTVASLVLATGYLVFARDHRPALEKMHRCGLDFLPRIPTGQTIVVRGGPLREGGAPVAHNESMMFAWLDRRGFTYGDEELSIPSLEHIAARGGRFWIASPREMNSEFADVARARFREIDRCGGYTLFDLTVAGGGSSQPVGRVAVHDSR